ncbi:MULTISPECIES: DUF938 domain-containing protein [unclassified Sulfitobacter]|uniref:DUF938 domain-containing protein n=1 Tax=unclassified Sulfitobacter TaxID=196795 RepID=UPI0007C2C2E9|nr:MULTISPECIES: DUF938 domain-containing protein [unclassified Sulfitobacter]KZY03698.1 methyltransferase [Sulfitobacter sp. HI0023]KZY27225.1 methyltransferase [Sulfitobacter sp. HI0040]KZZ64439.1 methyltransferase [Sulfitobacter sp. HI0129]
MSRKLPPSASVAQTGSDRRMYAPAAARNAKPLTELLLAHGPTAGAALELASGTGEHVVHFGTALPGLQWQPSDIDPARRDSIDAHVAASGLTNILPALPLDAAQPGWSKDLEPQQLVLVVNLFHLLPMSDVRRIITETARALAPGGSLIVYGPFRRGGALISEGDRKFDAELRTADPTSGYKDDLDIVRLLSDAALSPIDRVDMPANNLALIARNPPS